MKHIASQCLVEEKIKSSKIKATGIDELSTDDANIHKAFDQIDNAARRFLDYV